MVSGGPSHPDELRKEKIQMGGCILLEQRFFSRLSPSVKSAAEQFFRQLPREV